MLLSNDVDPAWWLLGRWVWWEQLELADKTNFLIVQGLNQDPVKLQEAHCQDKMGSLQEDKVGQGDKVYLYLYLVSLIFVE